MRYAKTEAGHRAIKDRTVALSPRQRGIFLLFDGKRDLMEVLRAASALGVAQDDIEHMVRLGLLEPANDSPAAVARTPAPEDNLRSRYLRAHPIALRLTAALGLKGFKLNLEVEEALDHAGLAELMPRIRDRVPPADFRLLEQALRGL